MDDGQKKPYEASVEVLQPPISHTGWDGSISGKVDVPLILPTKWCEVASGRSLRIHFNSWGDPDSRVG